MGEHKPEYVALARQLLIESLDMLDESLAALVEDTERDNIPGIVDGVHNVRSALDYIRKYAAELKAQRARGNAE